MVEEHPHLAHLLLGHALAPSPAPILAAPALVRLLVLVLAHALSPPLLLLLAVSALAAPALVLALLFSVKVLLNRQSELVLHCHRLKRLLPLGNLQHFRSLRFFT